mmetsp:Transcript_16790/g.14725  ORF Transcript_16790/g.14725 Transcript_16790/m.14725 type:complete len:118 (+) Transcript_16790:939-1292(+)
MVLCEGRRILKKIPHISIYIRFKSQMNISIAESSYNSELFRYSENPVDYFFEVKAESEIFNPDMKNQYVRDVVIKNNNIKESTGLEISSLGEKEAFIVSENSMKKPLTNSNPKPLYF